MNWKANYWTLLFALTAAGALYLFATSRHKVAPLTDDDTTATDTLCHIDTISNSTALGYLTAYEAGFLGYIAENKSYIDSRFHIKNPDILYFELDSCELSEMVAYARYGKVYAYIGVKDSLLDLIFLDQKSDVATFRAYDFSRPCPPACDLEPGH